MATGTFYPDAHPETKSVDGGIMSRFQDNTWSEIIAGSGTAVGDEATYDYLTCIGSSSTTNQWERLARGCFAFDLSSILGGSVSYAKFSVRGYTKYDNLDITPNLNIYSFDPSINTELGTGDFTHLGSTAFCDTPITYSGFNITGYNEFVLNAAGLAALNAALLADGIFGIGTKNANYDAANSAPVWADAQISAIFGYYSEQGDGYKPTLDVTYTQPNEPVLNATITLSSAEDSATIQADIISCIGGNVTQYVVEWGTETGVYTDDETYNGNWATGTLSHEIASGLSAGIYFARVRAYNASGWGYAAEISFTTKPISLWGTTAEWTAWKALETAPSHSALWSDMQDWATLHIDDECPDGTTSTMELDGVVNEVSNVVRLFITNMLVMYHLTDDTDYADAALSWALSVCEWTTWGAQAGTFRISLSDMSIAVAAVYYDLHDYMTAGNRATILAYVTAGKSDGDTKGLYDAYKSDYTPPWAAETRTAYPTTMEMIASGVGLMGLALGSDYADSETWVNWTNVILEHEFTDYGATAGSCNTGAGYMPMAFYYTPYYMDASRRLKAIDWFALYDDVLENSGYYTIYMSNYNNPPGNARRIPMEDSSLWFWNSPEQGHSCMYMFLLAKEYNNGCIDWWAENFALYSLNKDPFAYLWKSSTLSATAPSTGLPVYRVFSGSKGLGYLVYHTSWDDAGTTLIFKCGRSAGHTHANQNTIMLLNDGTLITGDKGYLVGEEQLNSSAIDNCISIGTAELGGNQWGYGQAMENSDDARSSTVPLGTTGDLLLTDIKNFYVVAVGDASALYTGETNDEPYDYPLNSSGAADVVKRFMVFIPDKNYMVVFDWIDLPSEAPVHQMWNSRDANGGWSVSSGVYYNTPNSGRIEVKPILPVSPAYFTATINLGLNPFLDVLGLTSTNGTSPRLITVLTPSDALSEETITTDAINQGNCQGVIVTSDDRKDLILFSTDGNVVNQWIELGDSFHAVDGESYSFDGTTVLANFSEFIVMSLAEGGGDVNTIATPSTAILDTIKYASILNRGYLSPTNILKVSSQLSRLGLGLKLSTNNFKLNLGSPSLLVTGSSIVIPQTVDLRLLLFAPYFIYPQFSGKLVGKYGYVQIGSKIVGIRHWYLDYISEMLDITTMGSSGVAVYKPSYSYWSGMFSGFKDGIPLMLNVADTINLVLAESSDSTHTWSGEAYIKGIHTIVNRDNVISYYYDFQSNNILTLPIG